MAKTVARQGVNRLQLNERSTERQWINNPLRRKVPPAARWSHFRRYHRETYHELWGNSLGGGVEVLALQFVGIRTFDPIEEVRR